MKILHVTDLHLNLRWMEWLRTSAPPSDLLCISGNLLDRGNPLPYAEQVKLALDWLQAIERPLCVCSGDHDLEWDERHGCWRKALWLEQTLGPGMFGDGSVFTLDGLDVHSVSLTTYPKGAPADIWVVHPPPSGTAVAREYSGPDYGDPTLPDAISRWKPKLVLCGRVHQPASWFERCDGVMYLNPGCLRTARFPGHILIDTETFEACRVVDSAVGAHSQTARWAAVFDDLSEHLAIA